MGKFSKKLFVWLLTAAVIGSLGGVTVFADEVGDFPAVLEETGGIDKTEAELKPESEPKPEDADVYEESEETDVYGEAEDEDVYGEPEDADVYGESKDADVYGESEDADIYGEAEWTDLTEVREEDLSKEPAEIGDADIAADGNAVDAGIRMLSLTPEDWTKEGYQAYHGFSHGVLEIGGADEEEEISLEVGETLTLSVTPFAHVQYMGCNSGDFCNPNTCGPLWEEGKGCPCAGTSPVLRIAAVQVTTDSDGIISFGEDCDYSGLSAAGETADGTITLTGLADGKVQVTVTADLYDWTSAEVTFTVVVGAGGASADDDEEYETIDVAGYEVWTTVDASTDQRMHFALTFSEAVACEDISALTQELLECGMTIAGSVDLGNGSNGGTLENVSLSADGKTLYFEVAGYFAPFNGRFVCDTVLKSLTTEDGAYAAVNVDFFVPNGLTSETVSQVIGSGNENASVTTRFLSDGNTSRAMIHLTVLLNGEPVNPNENGATAEGHWHDYTTLTTQEFAEWYYETLGNALGEDWLVTYDDDTMTVVYLNSSEGDVVDLHITTYLNTNYAGLDTSALAGLTEKAAGLLETLDRDADGYDMLWSCYTAANVRLNHSEHYSQAEIDAAVTNLQRALDAFGEEEGDAGDTGDEGGTGDAGDAGDTGGTGGEGGTGDAGGTGGEGGTGDAGGTGGEGGTGDAGGTGGEEITGDAGSTGGEGGTGDAGNTGDAGDAGSTGDAGEAGGTGGSGSGAVAGGSITNGSGSTGNTGSTGTSVNITANAKTNDTGNPALWIALIVVCAGALVVITCRRTRRY